MYENGYNGRNRLILSHGFLRSFLKGFDGFRFDSVSSILFKDHAATRAFSGDYAEYFSSETDHAGIEYLMLANHMLVCPSSPIDCCFLDRCLLFMGSTCSLSVNCGGRGGTNVLWNLSAHAVSFCHYNRRGLCWFPNPLLADDCQYLDPEVWPMLGYITYPGAFFFFYVS